MAQFSRSLLSAAAAVAASAGASAPCNLTGVWQSVGADDAITVLMDGASFSFVASAASGWSNQRGQYFPANARLTFECCGGIAGSVDAACGLIQWRDANADAWARGAPQSAALSTPMYSVGMGFLSPSGPPSIDTFAIFGAGAKTSNFALTGARMAGGTQLLPASAGRGRGGAVAASCAAGGCVLQEAPGSVTLSGVALADPAAAGTVVATEAWTLRQLNDSAFSFEVQRTWTADASAMSVDRVAIALRTTGGLPIHSEQIPGFVDLDVFVNATSTGGFDLGNGAFEFLSPNARQFVRFTPTGALFVVEGSATLGGAAAPALFSFAKPFADGTADCSLGVELIDPRGGPRAAPAAGTEQVVTLTFNLVETDIPAGADAGLGPFPRMDVALANATLQRQMEVLLGAQYQLLGWIMASAAARGARGAVRRGADAARAGRTIRAAQMRPRMRIRCWRAQPQRAHLSPPRVFPPSRTRALAGQQPGERAVPARDGVVAHDELRLPDAQRRGRARHAAGALFLRGLRLGARGVARPAGRLPVRALVQPDGRRTLRPHAALREQRLLQLPVGPAD